MFALLLIAAAPAPLQFGDPKGNVSEWIRDTDNQRAKVEGTVLFKVIFDPAGKPDRCDIVHRVGDPAAEKLVCNLVFKRFRSTPSFGGDAEPTYMVFQRSASFTMGRPGRALKAAPLVVFDATGGLSPKDSGKNLVVAVAVNEDGAIMKCAPTQWAKKKEDIALAQIACSSLPSSWRSLPELNAAGQPIRYLIAVELELRRAQDAAR